MDMTRRGFLLAVAAQRSARPNVVFIVADDMNDYGFMHALPGVQTPHLDEFRRSAITFERCYCAAPACVPSRAAFLSGLFPHVTGSYLNGSDPWGKAPFDTTESLPECCKASGYLTFGRGKQFHAPVPPEREKEMWSNDAWKGGFGPFPPEKDQVLGQWWGHTAWEGPDDDFPDVKNAAAAVEFLSAAHDRPFFLLLGLWRPHTPFTAPKRFFELYDPARIPLPPGFRAGDLDDVPEAGRKLARVWGERFDKNGAGDEKSWREFVHAYCATTSFADWSVGRVLEALDKSPYADNTIVIFISDNGYHCGEKEHWEKTTLWEKSALVPMAIRMPGRRHAGKRCGRTVGLIDIYPTLADLCGLRKPKHTLSGRSLRPLLENPQAKWDHPALTTYGEGFASVRDERYRYIRYPDGTEELYDHKVDGHEWTNLAGEARHAAAKQRLRALVPAQWAKSMGGRLG